MGTYYIAVSDECKEYIDPWFINDGGIKMRPCILRYPGLSNLVMYRLMHEWSGKRCRMVGDYGNEYEVLKQLYRNVSVETVHAFNEYASGSHPSILLNPDP